MPAVRTVKAEVVRIPPEEFSPDEGTSKPPTLNPLTTDLPDELGDDHLDALYEALLAVLTKSGRAELAFTMNQLDEGGWEVHERIRMLLITAQAQELVGESNGRPWKIP